MLQEDKSRARKGKTVSPRRWSRGERCRLGEGEAGYPPGTHATAREGEWYAAFVTSWYTAFVHAPCSCDVHRRGALGFVEDEIPRARVNGTMTLTNQITYLNPALHAVHQEVDLHSLLQQIRAFGGSADTAEERATGSKLTTAELRFFKSSTNPTGTIGLLRRVS